MAGVTDRVVSHIKRELSPCFPNVDDVVVLNRVCGCDIAINAPATITPIRTLQNPTLDSGFGNGIMVIGLGCEELAPERLVPKELAPGGRAPIEVASTADSPVLRLQDRAFGGFIGMTGATMGMAERHLEHLNKRQREICPAPNLVVGVQRGDNGASSGVTVNPAVGPTADLVVRADGMMMSSEMTEARDTVHLLTPRAINEDVSRVLLHEMA